MGIAPPVPLESMNTSKTKKSASSAGLVAMGIVQPALLESIATVTAATSAFGVAQVEWVTVPQAQVVFTKNN